MKPDSLSRRMDQSRLFWAEKIREREYQADYESRPTGAMLINIAMLALMCGLEALTR